MARNIGRGVLNWNIRDTLGPWILPISAQFYIQLVFKAPLCITLTISDQKNREWQPIFSTFFIFLWAKKFFL